MRHVLVMMLLMSLLIASGGCPRRAEPTARRDAPPIIRSADFRPEDYRGRVVVMDFWATWCGPCRQVMPAMQRLHEKYASRPVSILGMNISETGDPQAFMRHHGYTYTLVVGADELARRYGVRGIPTFIVLGTDGEAIFHAIGASRQNEENLEAAIETELARRGL